jgi:uncharacterized membrane protein YphA (DoxX/SURF4 family)
MLNTFPSLLVYGFYAPTLLRLGLVAVFIWLAWRTWQKRTAWRHATLPIIGSQSWIPTLAVIAEVALGAMFFFGWHTQIAAVLGILAALKYFIYARWWPRALEVYFPISAGTAFLILVICVSLLLSGAGAVAYDLPL